MSAENRQSRERPARRNEATSAIATTCGAKRNEELAQAPRWTAFSRPVLAPVHFSNHFFNPQALVRRCGAPSQTSVELRATAHSMKAVANTLLSEPFALLLPLLAAFPFAFFCQSLSLSFQLKFVLPTSRIHLFCDSTFHHPSVVDSRCFRKCLCSRLCSC